MARLAIGLAGAAIGGAIAGPVGARIGFAVASTAASYYMQPDVNTQGPQLADTRVTSAAYGGILPVVWGTFPVAGNIIDASPTRTVETTTSTSGKGGPEQNHTTYSYFGDLAVAMCEGEIDAVLLIRANGKVIFDADPNAEAARAEWLKFTVYPGSETQQPDPTFEALHGAGEVSAYRGTAYIVFEDFAYSEFGTTAVNFEFVVTRTASSSLTRQATQVCTTGSTSQDAGIIHDPASDLLIIALQGDANYAAVGVDPYSREVVWRLDHDGKSVTTNIEPAAKDIYLAEGVCIATPGNFVIQKRGPTAISGTWYYDIDAYSGESGLLAEPLESSTYSAGGDLQGLAYSYYDDLCIGDVYFVVDVNTLGPFLYRTNREGIPGPQLIDIPDGWYPAGPLCSNGAGSILVPITDDFAVETDWRVAVVTRETWSEVGDVDATPIGIAWCGDRWLCCTDDSGEFVFVLDQQTDIIGDTISFSSDYGITDVLYFNGQQRGIAYSAGENAAYVQGANAIYRINLSDPTEPPKQWAFGVSDPIMLYHAQTDRVWWSPDAGANAYSMRLNSATGSPAALSDIVSDLTTSGTRLTTGDVDVTALASTDVRGFAVAQAMPRRNALAQLQTAFLFDYVARDGELVAVTRGQSSSATLTEDHIGAYIEGGSPSEPWTIKRAAPDSLPVQVEVNFVDPDKAYEAGTQLAKRQANAIGTTQRVSLAIALTNDEAAQIADTYLHLSHIEAEAYETQVMPSQVDSARPAEVLTTDYDGEVYTYRVVDGSIIDGRMVAMRALREIPEVFTGYAIGGTVRAPGGAVKIIGSTIIWPMDLPALRDTDRNPGVYLAAASYSTGWAGCEVQKSSDGVSFSPVESIGTEATMGYAVTAPTTGVAGLWDAVTTLTVRLINGALSTTSRTAPTFAAWGVNGRWEVIAFTTATQNADGDYEISDIARGLRDTGQHIGAHAIADQFVVLNTTTLADLLVSSTSIGSTEYVRAVTFGRADSSASAVPYPFTAERVEPFAPVALHAEKDGSNNWNLSWRRQDRVGGQSLWTRPNSEADESYTITIYASDDTVARTETVTDATEYQYTAADQAADFGYSPQELTWSVAQRSALTGDGHVATLTSGAVTDYYALIVSDSPQMFHPLNDTSGTTADDAMNTRNGTYVGSPTLNQSPVLTSGAAVDLSGSGQYISFTAPWTADQIFSVEFAFAADALPGSGSMCILRTTYNGDTDTRFSIAVTLESTGKLRFRHWPNSYTTPQNDVQSTATLSAGTRYHVIINWGYTSGNIDIYINGALDKSQAVVSYCAVQTGNVHYGHDTANDTSFSDFDGKLQAVSWWTAIQGSTQRDAHFFAGGLS